MCVCVCVCVDKDTCVYVYCVNQRKETDRRKNNGVFMGFITKSCMHMIAIFYVFIKGNPIAGASGVHLKHAESSQSASWPEQILHR